MDDFTNDNIYTERNTNDVGFLNKDINKPQSKELPLYFEDFYYGFENNIKLPDNFCQKIVELENEFHRRDEYDEKLVEELAYLYKVKS